MSDKVKIGPPRTIDDKKAHLIKVFNLSSDQMYVADDKLLITRSGCDVLLNNYPIQVQTKMTAVTYGDKAAVFMEGVGVLDGERYQTNVTVSPDTVAKGMFHYAEIAEYRIRLRIVFKMLRLFDMDIMPSEGFIIDNPHKEGEIVSATKEHYEKAKNRGKRPVPRNSRRKTKKV